MSAQARKRLQVGVYALSLMAAAVLMFALFGPSQPAHGSSDDEGGGEPPPDATATPQPEPPAEEQPLPTPAPDSYYGTPAEYDLDAINEDEGYYSRVDASRMHQFSTEDRHELPDLRFVSEGTQLTTVSQGVSSLTVRAEAGRPITYYAMDGGVFSNGRNCITVKADNDGLASTSFHADQQSTYRVQVSSPENNGPFIFQIIVRADE